MIQPKGRNCFSRRAVWPVTSTGLTKLTISSLPIRTSANPDYKPDAAKTFDPKGFPAAAQEFALADFGPNLSNIAAKFQSQPDGLKWLSNWIGAPEKYHPKSLMPNLQLSAQDASRHCELALSVPAEWPVKVDVPGVDDKDVKAGASTTSSSSMYPRAEASRRPTARLSAISLSEIDQLVEKELTTDDKLLYLGEKTISRLGCFGCHVIPGFESAKPIGTALNDWGIKRPGPARFRPH